MLNYARSLWRVWLAIKPLEYTAYSPRGERGGELVVQEFPRYIDYLFEGEDEKNSFFVQGKAIH